MSNRVQGLSKRIWAMILTVVMILGMIPTPVFAVTPSTVTTTLGTTPIYMGEEVIFTVETKANDHMLTQVFGYFDFNGGDWSAIEYLKYKESRDGNWYDLVQGVPFGPPEKGFPMMDAASTFCVKFKEAGTYSFSVSMKTADENKTELCGLTESITVLRKPCQITTSLTDSATSLVVGTPTEFTVHTTPNGYAGEMVFGKFAFSDWDAVDTLEYWGTSENQWLELPEDTLFGPAAKGFPLIDTESKFRVTFNTSGKYTFNIAMVKAELDKPAEEKTVLAEISEEITVTEEIPPVVDTVSGNPENWAQSATITVTVSDQGGSGVQKVVYSKDSAYAATHAAATLSEGVFTFTVEENATYYVWAIDGNGNISEEKAIEINKIDRTPPELSVQADHDSWTKEEVTIEITANDESSDVTVKYHTENVFDKASELSINEGKAKATIEAEYDGEYYIWAVDAAGNKSQMSVKVQIDKTIPTIAITTVPSDVWTNQNITIEGAVEDSGSTVANSGIEKVVFGTDEDPANAPGEATLVESKYSFTVEENGTYNVWALDNAGNYSKIATIEIKNIDKTIPTVTAINAPTQWVNQDVEVTVEASDLGESGIQKIVYSEEAEYSADLPAAELVSAENYKFTVAKKDFADSYYIWAVDNAGNISEAATVELHMDVTIPVVDAAADIKVWTNQSVTIRGAASDNASAVANSEIAKVVYNTTGEFVADAAEAALSDDGSYSFVVENTKDFSGKYYVWAIDNAGNISNRAEVDVYVDITAPVVDSIKNISDKAWVNEDVNITGSVSDLQETGDKNGSGVAEVVYGTTNKFDEAKDKAVLNKEDGTFSFPVECEDGKILKATYYIWAVDGVGKHSETPASTEVKIDKVDPTGEARIEPYEDAWTDILETLTFGIYRNDDVEVTCTETSKDIEDGSSKATISYCIGDFSATSKDGVIENLKKTEIDWFAYEEAVVINEDLKAAVYFRLEDEAGNVTYLNTNGIIRDTTPPVGEIVAYRNDPEAQKCVKWEVWDVFTEEASFRNYHNNTEIQMLIIADDKADPEKENPVASGVKNIKYFTSTGFYDKETIKGTGIVWKEYEGAVTFNPNQRLVFYARIEDNSGNVTYLSTDGIILDDKEPSGNATESGPDFLIDVEGSDDENPVIFNTDVTVDITVYDPKFGENSIFSGLQTIEYLVYTGEGGEENGVRGYLYGGDEMGEYLICNPDNDKDLSNPKIDVDEGTNRTHSWSGKIKIPAAEFNSNNVYVKITAVDKAGNKHESLSEKISIDVTPPAVTVSFNDVADGPENNKKYFKETRTATITVTERNFDRENNDFSFGYLRDGSLVEVLPKNLTWRETSFGDQPNGDGKTYEATYEFEWDADYLLDGTGEVKIDSNGKVTEPYFVCHDMAGNSFYYVDDEGQRRQVTFFGEAPKDFTVDTRAPEVSVSYDNDSAENEKYFKDHRTATVTIVEHNLPSYQDLERIVFTQTAGRGGEKPQVSWSHTGDTHTATFVYDKDGDYTFDVSITDLAGNKNATVNYGTSVAPKDFIVDTTYEDMISQSGVENGVAYGYDADVIPNVKIFDINLQEYEVTLTGIQKDMTIDLTEEVNALLTEETETVTGIFDIFETKQDLDGIYTLKLYSKDKAGNEDSLEIVFTVNRFGSVYVFDDYLLNLIKDGGAFAKKVDNDLIITEYNADKLVADSLKIEITVDGRPLDNVQYTVTPEINDTVSTGSSGWYQYTYTISKDNFTTDGVYKISVSSEDATGNTPENNNYADLGISFRVDSTKAEITSVVGLEEDIINAQEVTVQYTVFDTIGLKNIKVYVDGNIVDEITDFTADSNNYSGSFTLKERSSAQKVQIVVEDLAGNVTDTAAKDFAPAYAFNDSVTVSTNIFVRWYANKALFWGSIGGFVVLVAAIIVLIVAKKKKKAAAK